jgi:hypothetical protein
MIEILTKEEVQQMGYRELEALFKIHLHDYCLLRDEVDYRNGHNPMSDRTIIPINEPRNYDNFVIEKSMDSGNLTEHDNKNGVAFTAVNKTKKQKPQKIAKKRGRKKKSIIGVDNRE